MTASAPACIPCGRFFRAHKTGARVMECMPRSNNTPPGIFAATQWDDYKIWSCDLWRCEGCGAIIASGYGREPIAEQHEPEFATWRDASIDLMNGHLYRIYDC